MVNVQVTCHHKAMCWVGTVGELVQICLARMADVRALGGPVRVDEVEGTIRSHGQGDVRAVAGQIWWDGLGGSTRVRGKGRFDGQEDASWGSQLGGCKAEEFWGRDATEENVVIAQCAFQPRK